MNRRCITVVKANNYKGLCIRHTFVKRELFLLIILKALPDIYPRVPLFQFYSILHMILLLYRSILLLPRVPYSCWSRTALPSVSQSHCFQWYNWQYRLLSPRYNLSKETPQNAFLHSMKHSEGLWPDYISIYSITINPFSSSILNNSFLSVFPSLTAFSIPGPKLITDG